MTNESNDVKGLHKFTAKTQTSGIGTHGRVWVSPVGGFYASYAVFLDKMSHGLQAVNIAESLLSYLQQSAIPCQLKEPNDIMVGEHKLAGVLVEQEMHSGMWLLRVGVGINVLRMPVVGQRKVAFVQQYAHMTIVDIEQLTDKVVFGCIYRL